MELPVENKRVRQIIEYFCRGNELQFSREIGVSQPRINRLFAKDSRNNRFPLVSFDIVKAILKKFEELGLDPANVIFSDTIDSSNAITVESLKDLENVMSHEIYLEKIKKL